MPFDEKRITLSLTNEEHSLIKEVATQLGLGTDVFVKKLILDTCREVLITQNKVDHTTVVTNNIIVNE